MASETTRQDIANSFGHIVAADESLVAECVNMCHIFNLSAESLLWKWEALSYSSTRSLATFTMDSAHALKTQIQRDIAAENSRKQKIQSNLNGSMSRGRIPGSMKGGGTGIHKSTITITSKPSMRSGLGIVKPEMASIAGPRQVAFSGHHNDEASRTKRAYRYMYEKVSERSEALDDRIDEFSELVRDYYKLDDLGDPSSSAIDEITVVGRITLDSESSSSGTVKLNEASLTLESSRMMGSGARIPLRFTPSIKIRGGPKGARGLGLFPGAIVALRGRNGGAGWFLVQEILTLPPLPISPLCVRPSAEGTAFSACVASGPFTLHTDLDYTPWHHLLQILKTTRPAVVLLIGPFIDSDHPQIKNGDIENTATQLFQDQFTEHLNDFFSLSPSSLVLIVPSVRDIISDHAVFPQCELSPQFSGDPRVHLLPNPARFSINDVSFAVSSIDVLFHLRKEEYLKRGEEVDAVPDASGADAMSNLCRHLLQQRSFYPIFPVPLDLSHNINLSLTHFETGLKLDGFAPDILIVPSKLKHFSKMVHNTMAINPSHLSKGTYSTMSVAAGASLKDRLKVEVLRLEDVGR